MSAPDCAKCGDEVDPETARMYVTADGEEALVLCLWCRTSKPTGRQYQPDEFPTESRVALEEGRQ